MAKDNVTTLVFRGVLNYAKVLGDPVLNYAGDGKEWKFDFAPNNADAAKKELKRLGVADRIRTKDEYFDEKPYMSFKHREFKANGEPNQRLRIVDADNNEWPQHMELGNGTVADVKFVVVDNGKGKFKGVYPRSIRVLEHVPFERKEFDDLDENDEYYHSAREAAEQARRERELKQFQKDFGLAEDDEVVEDDLNDDLDDIGYVDEDDDIA